ncbi:hypothetical protein ACWT_3185 [Actinoplanes sp. SE50]|uniref:hypothetical protein n=1 Tax=unclassified Actinoplanes TaxID=2626549 RepID=UPI00023EC7AA|nr:MULTISPECIES: hypothetical protein [unclassified Actinoplanes]AEV84208.1 hypothetical protein ACPL_3313 [Actinoplanes sp. SE50/110]ATO82600.1 hypothetical protein ACWT_3185 [Actinoplanes sp. SE50]SLM00007.1 hypothetical protein ACSP50_3239 [Actinoplanes sp. SE50/110]
MPLCTAEPAAAWDRPYDIYQVVAPDKPGTYAHTEPRFASPTTTFLANGTQLDINCRGAGEAGTTRVLSGATSDNPDPHWIESTTARWVRLSDGTWVFDGHTDTDPGTPAISSCAATPLLSTPTCVEQDQGCATDDPEVSRCVTAGLVKLASAPIGDPDQGMAELWYSRGCRAGWIRARWTQPPSHFAGRTDRVVLTVGRQDDFPVSAAGRPAALLWGRMAVAQRGECISGHASYPLRLNGGTIGFSNMLSVTDACVRAEAQSADGQKRGELTTTRCADMP